MTVERFLVVYKDLNMLRECRYNPYAPVKPTWVPDWSHSPSGQIVILGLEGSSYLRTQVGQPVDGLFQLAGVSAATIETLEPLPLHVDWRQEADANSLRRGLHQLIMGSDHEKPSAGTIEDSKLGRFYKNLRMRSYRRYLPAHH